jgi:hypothetical protein
MVSEVAGPDGTLNDDVEGENERLANMDSELWRITAERMQYWLHHFRNAVFRPRRFDGDMLLVTTAKSQHLCELWTPQVGGRILSHVVPYEHKKFTQPAPLKHIARILEEYLLATR